MRASALGEPLGFAIERSEIRAGTDVERYWSMSKERFKAEDDGLPSGTPLSTSAHPMQAFQWGDYTAKPNRIETTRCRIAIRTWSEEPTKRCTGGSYNKRLVTDSLRHQIVAIHHGFLKDVGAYAMSNRCTSALGTECTNAVPIELGDARPPGNAFDDGLNPCAVSAAPDSL
jgi:hypothetical protein